MSRFLGAAFVLLAFTPYALAGTHTDFIEVSTGLFDNASDGYRTYAMRVTADTDWTNADIDIVLTSGSLIHVPPPFLGSPNGVNGLGDTAGFAPTNVLGDLTQGFNGTAGFAGSHVETATTFQSSWFTTETNDIGTFDIAMVTFTPDANGRIRFRTIAGSEVENGGYGGEGIPFFIIDGVVFFGCPEPGSLVLIGIGLVSLLGTRRRS